VWAEENTRESIFASLKRREVYATSGSRMAVRFYEYGGVSGYDPCADPSFPAGALNRGGVPMGATMSRHLAPPKFVVQALKDTTDLDEIQIVKASSDTTGAITESIVEKKLVPAQGALACVTWSDPAWVPSRPSFYYARVLEKRVPRWSVQDCKKVDAAAFPRCAETDPAKGGLNTTIRERAWTSPIWHLP
jgi:Protein of unknown function (DUF3604)